MRYERGEPQTTPRDQLETVVIAEGIAERMEHAAELLADTTEQLRRMVDRLDLALGEKEWLTHEEAAEYLRLTPAALHAVARSEDVPRHRITGRRYRYSRREVDEWLRSR